MRVDEITREIKACEKSRPTLLRRFKSQIEEAGPARKLRKSSLGGNRVWRHVYVKGRKCFQTGVANCVKCSSEFLQDEDGKVF